MILHAPSSAGREGVRSDFRLFTAGQNRTGSPPRKRTDAGRRGPKSRAQKPGPTTGPESPAAPTAETGTRNRQPKPATGSESRSPNAAVPKPSYGSRATEAELRKPSYGSRDPKACSESPAPTAKPKKPAPITVPRKLPPRELPPRKLPPGNCPQETAPRKLPPGLKSRAAGFAAGGPPNHQAHFTSAKSMRCGRCGFCGKMRSA